MGTLLKPPFSDVKNNMPFGQEEFLALTANRIWSAQQISWVVNNLNL
jgi:hypothetical protein